MGAKNKVPFLHLLVVLLIVACACNTTTNDALLNTIDSNNNFKNDNRLYEETLGDYRFVVNSDNTITITKYLGSEFFVEIPTEIAGKTVTAIGNTLEGGGAFEDCSTITNVAIPDGVTEIQNNAFSNCTHLVMVTVPASVTHLGDELFIGCPNIDSIYFEGDAPEVEGDVFGILPSQITVYYYKSSVGWSSPWHMYPTEAYGDYLYEINSDGTITVTEYRGYGGDIEIPGTISGKKVTAIGESFLVREEHVSSVVIPAGVIKIQNNAFSNCPILRTVTVPVSTTLLGEYVFSYCPSLYAVYFEGDAPKADDSILKASPQAIAYYHEGTAGWTDSWYGCGVKTYEDYQYRTNDDGTVTITKYVGSGGNITIPAEIDGKVVSAIGNTFSEKGAFQDCDTISSVIIPKSITEIQDNAFYNCTGLRTVEISSGVSLIRNCAFAGCSNLQSVYFEGDAPQLGNYVFDCVPQITVYYNDKTNGWSNPWYGCPAVEGNQLHLMLPS